MTATKVIGESVKKTNRTFIKSYVNDYVDMLNKDGLVTDYQAYNWSNPF